MGPRLTLDLPVPARSPAALPEFSDVVTTKLGAVKGAVLADGSRQFLGVPYLLRGIYYAIQILQFTPVFGPMYDISFPGVGMVTATASSPRGSSCRGTHFHPSFVFSFQ